VKILPVRAQLFHADGQTDMTMSIFDILNFVNVPEKTLIVTIICMWAN